MKKGRMATMAGRIKKWFKNHLKLEEVWQTHQLNEDGSLSIKVSGGDSNLIEHYEVTISSNCQNNIDFDDIIEINLNRGDDSYAINYKYKGPSCSGLNQKNIYDKIESLLKI